MISKWMERAGLAMMLAVVVGCDRGDEEEEEATPVPGAPWAAATGVGAEQVALERNWTPDDVVAALRIYMPSGRIDEHIMFASGGHSGQVFAIGVASMRLLKTIGGFTPEPWQGYGFGTGEEALQGGDFEGRKISWADTHRPALSEAKGEYDGQFLFNGDNSTSCVA